MPLGGPPTQPENAPLTSRYIRSLQNGINKNGIQENGPLSSRSSSTSSLNSVQTEPSLRRLLTTRSPSPRVVIENENPYLSPKDKKKKRVTYKNRILEAQQWEKDMDALVNAQRGKIKQDQQRNFTYKYPVPPSEPSRKYRTPNTKKRKILKDQDMILQPMLDKLMEKQVEKALAKGKGISKKRKGTMRRKTKRKHHKKKYRNSRR